MAMKKGDKVSVEYEGKLESGEVFDSSERHGKPLEFEIGAGLVIPAFESAITAMKKGEEKEIKIQPEDAYGLINPDMMQKVPRNMLPPSPEPKVGMVLGIKVPSGQQFPATITQVTEKEITVDLNHPLAGKTLLFKIKLVSVNGE